MDRIVVFFFFGGGGLAEVRPAGQEPGQLVVALLITMYAELHITVA